MKKASVWHLRKKCAGLAKIRGVKMNKSIKSMIKPVVDIFMTVLLLFLMGYQSGARLLTNGPGR